MELASKKCIPCSTDATPMAREEAEKLVRALNGWSPAEFNGILKLQKDFIFKNFKEAIAFTNKVADIAEAEGHHPNIRIHKWNHVEIENFTHKINGLSENDFILAAKIDSITRSESTNTSE